jgi:EAL domain-containing protein (putative c-di-GMP-specific phosphodiesterase class I)
VEIGSGRLRTGYSSLKYLTVYPVNKLKIAQELVFRVIDDPRNAAVVRAAVRLARELGIESVAEGVETEAQASFLLSAGCGLAQGHYYSGPVNADAVPALLRQGNIVAAQKPALLEKRPAA